MKIEHIAFQVPDPVNAAKWFVANLGFRIARQDGPPSHGHFLADSSGKVMVELYNNPKVKMPDYYAMDPMELHLAFTVDDVAATCARLIAAGATPDADMTISPVGDHVAILRDPWGLPIQFVKRAKPMV